MSKIHANHGVKRHKKPLQNLVFKVEEYTEEDIKESFSIEDWENRLKESFERLKHSDGKYYVLSWQWEKVLNDLKYERYNTKGYITEHDLRIKLGYNHWQKFRQGKRIFIIQRRFNGKNI